MVIRNVSLDIVCGVTSTIPKTDKPEVAFAGKSNVGKSSLINAMINRKALARTSSSPGKTQTINFYNINDAMYMVDLPGYGYAKASRTEVEKWGKMIEKYLRTSRNLKTVFLLVDIRHAPGENDKIMYNWVVKSGYQPVIIATKLDKLKRSQVPRCIRTIREELRLSKDTVLIPFSSETKQGREEVWNLIDRLIAGEETHEETVDAGETAQDASDTM